MSAAFRSLIPGCRLSVQQNLGGCSSLGRRFFSMRPLGHWDPFGDAHARMRDMERNFQRMERDMEHVFGRLGFPKFMPTFSRTIPLETSEHGNMHRINLDLTGFKPEDVKVSLKDRVVTIDAKLEETGSDGSRLYQEFRRKFTLPESVDIENLKSIFSSESGVLSIEAPLKNPPKIEDKSTEIPINRIEGSDSKQG